MIAPPSFRSEYRSRAAGYRTPSPPRNAIEPLSPLSSTFPPYPRSDGSTMRKRKLDTSESPPSKVKRGPAAAAGRQPAPLDTNPPTSTHVPSALDVFAAVATSPSLAPDFKSPSSGFPSSTSYVNAFSHAINPPYERSAKRTQSEVLVFPSSELSTPRPFTSHYNGTRPADISFAPETLTDGKIVNGLGLQSVPILEDSSSEHSVLQQDAELLLSFSRSSFAQRTTSVRDRGPFQHRAPIPQQKPLEPSVILPDPQPAVMNNVVSHSKAENTASEPRSHDFATTPQAEATQPDPNKPREHRGWPKGKPRGPRAPGAVRKKRSDARDGKVEPKARASRGGRRKVNQLEKLESRDAPASLHARRRNSVPHIPLGHLSPTTQHSQLTSRSSSLPPRTVPAQLFLEQDPDIAKISVKPQTQVIFCPACQLSRKMIERFQDRWICCTGCSRWLHAACAGFDTEKLLKQVDRYHCSKCVDRLGPTTFVRKSSRAHVSLDYAGLHEGKIRTAVDVPDHHYIGPIKDGALTFQPETFVRMPPELVTAEYFARCGGWTEPILIPASMNPRPRKHHRLTKDTMPENPADQEFIDQDLIFDRNFDYDLVFDDGQDKLDMVIPQDLTVRRAAELYGPEEKVDVIDVKLQEGEDRRWSMRQWADYYEAEGEKPVRNVISLEVSQSPLGRLIRRPKVVRDLDLQDSVWPVEDTAKGVVPRVQFYCLMSVADCYTDFHIDFGGSSVYYHILKGRKTFFFIPPKPKYLKKYEDWCNSPDQNSVFLGNETKECYRVDLYPGDTMLIPSGWIHAVWTPENSLVIGGNFLTRLNYGMQIEVNDIEKATNVTRKFRYPYFQKILWLTAVQYLQQDPIPSTVADKLCAGGTFERRIPVWYELDGGGDDTTSPELYNARHYPEGEIQGLTDLIRYLYRTVMICLGRVPAVTKSTQDAVIRSMPKNCGDHLDFIKTFAWWAAWKRGNEEIPSWAYTDAALSDMDAGLGEKKLSAAAQRRVERQAKHEAHKAASDRRSLRAREVPAVMVEPAESGTKDVRDPRPQPDSSHIAREECRRRRSSCSRHANETEPLVKNSSNPRFGVKVIPRSPSPSDTMVDTTNMPNASVKSEAALMVNGVTGIPSMAQDQIATNHFSSTMPPSEGSSSLIYQAYTQQVTPQQTGTVDSSYQTLASNSQDSVSAACMYCRKTELRCIHSGTDSVDSNADYRSSVPIRPEASVKRPRSEDDESPIEPKGSRTSSRSNDYPTDRNILSNGERSYAAAVQLTAGYPHAENSPAPRATPLPLNDLSNGRPHQATPPVDIPQMRAFGQPDHRNLPVYHQHVSSLSSAPAQTSSSTSNLAQLHDPSNMPTLRPAVNGLAHHVSNYVVSDSSPTHGGIYGMQNHDPEAIFTGLGEIGFSKPNNITKKRSSSRSTSRELDRHSTRISMSPSKKSPRETRFMTQAEAEEAENLKLRRSLAVDEYSLRPRAS